MKYITYLDYKKILQIAEKEQNNIPERYTEMVTLH